MSDQWYITRGNQQAGPYSAHDLWHMASCGGVHPTDFVWTQGMAAWLPAAQIAGLFPQTNTSVASPNSVAVPATSTTKDDQQSTQPATTHSTSAPPRVMMVCGRAMKWYHILSMVLHAADWLGLLSKSVIAYYSIPQARRALVDLGAAKRDLTNPLFGVLLLIGVHFVLYRISDGIMTGKRAAVVGLVILDAIVLGATYFMLTQRGGVMCSFLTLHQTGYLNAIYLTVLSLPALATALISWRKLEWQ